MRAVADGTYLRDALKGKEVLDKAGYPEVLRRADRRIAKVRQPLPAVLLTVHHRVLSGHMFTSDQ